MSDMASKEELIEYIEDQISDYYGYGDCFDTYEAAEWVYDNIEALVEMLYKVRRIPALAENLPEPRSYAPPPSTDPKVVEAMELLKQRMRRIYGSPKKSNNGKE